MILYSERLEINLQELGAFSRTIRAQRATSSSLRWQES